MPLFYSGPGPHLHLPQRCWSTLNSLGSQSNPHTPLSLCPCLPSDKTTPSLGPSCLSLAPCRPTSPRTSPLGSVPPPPGTQATRLPTSISPLLFLSRLPFPLAESLVCKLRSCHFIHVPFQHPLDFELRTAKLSV